MPNLRNIDQCPHCGTAHVMTDVLWNDLSRPERWYVVRCLNKQCQKLILLRVDAISGELFGIYPTGTYELQKNASISDEIRGEFCEAGLCLDAGCFKASMVMSRRVLQRCLKEQGCKKNKLTDSIQEAIDSGLLRSAFHGIATEIREYGNLGAHPDDEQLANASKENAQTILNFLRLLIHEFYEVPAQASKLKQQRSKLAATT